MSAETQDALVERLLAGISRLVSRLDGANGPDSRVLLAMIRERYELAESLQTPD